MGRFDGILRVKYGESIVAAQDAARQQFVTLINDSGFHQHQIGEPHTAKVSLVVGVATWNGYDRKMLDRLDEQLPSLDPAQITISLFDIDACHSMDEIRERIPGIDEVLQTPAVGLWVDGKLVETAQGFHGRQLVERIVLAESQLSNSSVRQPVTA